MKRYVGWVCMVNCFMLSSLPVLCCSAIHIAYYRFNVFSPIPAAMYMVVIPLDTECSTIGLQLRHHYNNSHEAASEWHNPQVWPNQLVKAEARLCWLTELKCIIMSTRWPTYGFKMWTWVNLYTLLPWKLSSWYTCPFTTLCFHHVHKRAFQHAPNDFMTKQWTPISVY